MATNDAILRRLAALEKSSVSQAAPSTTTNIKMPAINITIDLGSSVKEAAKRRLRKKSGTPKDQPGTAPMPKQPPRNKQGDPVMIGPFE